VAALLAAKADQVAVAVAATITVTVATTTSWKLAWKGKE
jgi:hypothetical protein